MIDFDCPSCGRHYSLSDRFAGRDFFCSGCRAELVVPNRSVEKSPSPFPPLPPPPPTDQLKTPPTPPPLPPSQIGQSAIPLPPPIPQSSNSTVPALPEPGSYETTTHDEILACVFGDKHRDGREQQEQPAVAEPSPQTSLPAERSTLSRTLFFWASIVLLLIAVLGLSVYLSLFVDWQVADSRLLLVERLIERKNQAFIDSRNKETETGALKLRVLETWNTACESIDSLLVTLGELDGKRADLTELDRILALNKDNAEIQRTLMQKRNEITAAIRAGEERVAALRFRIDDGVRTASEGEIETDLDAQKIGDLRAESRFYEEEVESIRKRIVEFPNERVDLPFPSFEAGRNRIPVDRRILLDSDWTEGYFRDFAFTSAQQEPAAGKPGRHAAAFDGVRRMFGFKSLRVTSFEKMPTTILFPNEKNARTRYGPNASMTFALRFPDFNDPSRAEADPDADKFDELRIRVGNSAGYVEYRTVSARYCEALFYEARGRFFLIGFPLEGNAYWKRTDHFDMANFDRSDDSLDSALAGSTITGDDENAPTAGRSFFSRLDWAELQLTPTSLRTTFWIDGIAISEHNAAEAFDLLSVESQQKETRDGEREWHTKRRNVTSLTAFLASLRSEKPIRMSESDPTDMSQPAMNVAPKSPDDSSGGELEFAGTAEERIRKFMTWILQDAKGRIRARSGDQSLSLGSKSPVPESLSEIRFDEIDLSGFQQLTDEQLDQIGRRKELKRLNLSRTALTDKRLLKLATLESLESLNLAGNNLTFEAFPLLRTLKNLKELNVDGIKSSVRGIDALGSLTSLVVLSLSRSGVDSGDLIYLLPLVELETLDLSSTKIGDRALTTLRVFTSLKSLNLSRTRITGAGLVSLDALRKLDKLQLDGCALNDDCLGAIGRIPNLESVSAIQTEITREGIRAKLGGSWIRRFKLSSGGE